MSIIVKGVQLPDCCDECLVYDPENRMCNLTGDDIRHPYSDRGETCLLVEVEDDV